MRNNFELINVPVRSTNIWILRVVRVGQEHLVVSVHLELAAKRRDFVGAPLVEPVVALVAVESREEKSAAALAESEREECLANELMRDVRRESHDIQYFHANLITFNRANVGVPWDGLTGIRLVHFAHVERQIATAERLRQHVSQPHAGHHLHGRALLVRQVCSQEQLRLLRQRPRFHLKLTRMMSQQGGKRLTPDLPRSAPELIAFSPPGSAR